MWYLLLFSVLVWVVYKLRKKKKIPDLHISTHSNRIPQQESKKQTPDFLGKPKKNYKAPASIETVLLDLENAVHRFIENHGVPIHEVKETYKKLEMPKDLQTRENFLRREISKHYKNRDNPNSKSQAIYLSLKHAQLLIEHPRTDWKNFSGLQKLQTNLKSEDYFKALLGIMMAYADVFKEHATTEKLEKDIQRISKLQDSQKNAFAVYQENCAAYKKARNASDKHFIILPIISYLHRRYKFNPRFKEDLISWCLKDVSLYEKFLMEFEKFNFYDKRGKLKKYTFEDVKKNKDYAPPRLSSFDVLWEIYERDNNIEKLVWLKSVSKHIKYRDFANRNILPEQKAEKTDTDYLTQITQTIEVPRSGKKGKLAFINSKNQECSTGDVFRDYMEQRGWQVVEAGVSFWQAMFCLSFWEEIFYEMGNPKKGADIPFDLFKGAGFYLNRESAIDKKVEYIKQQKLKDFINSQISRYQGYWTRLIYDGEQNSIQYIRTDSVQSFLDAIDSNVFSKFVYRIAQNPNENRSGVPGFIIWNNQFIKMIHTKKGRGKVIESQMAWIEWMVAEGITVEIIRVKGV